MCGIRAPPRGGLGRRLDRAAHRRRPAERRPAALRPHHEVATTSPAGDEQLVRLAAARGVLLHQRGAVGPHELGGGGAGACRASRRARARAARRRRRGVAPGARRLDDRRQAESACGGQQRRQLTGIERGAGMPSSAATARVRGLEHAIETASKEPIAAAASGAISSRCACSTASHGSPQVRITSTGASRSAVSRAVSAAGTPAAGAGSRKLASAWRVRSPGAAASGAPTATRRPASPSARTMLRPPRVSRSRTRASSAGAPGAATLSSCTVRSNRVPKANSRP